MIRFLRFVFGTISVLVSVLAGNWVGGQIRSEQTGRPVSPIFTEFEIGERSYKNFPSVTRFYPAVLLTAVSEPRWFWSFAWGVLLGLLVDDSVDRALMTRIFSFLEEK